jgi:hypothetical protein
MTTAEKLSWGASRLVPDGVEAAWGARLIVNQEGWVDLVPGRQSAIGSNHGIATLLGYLNGGANKKWMARLEEMLRAGEVRVNQSADVTVYEDATLVVRGNTNASHGYFYLAAWLKEES